MIHAYNKFYLTIAQQKLGSIFELAVYQEKLSIEEITKKFLDSNICRAFEKGNPIYLLGKSANELLGLILNKKIGSYEQNMFASPEYWVGWILVYVQWKLNKSFANINSSYSTTKLLLDYFPYHEMDETATLELIKKHLSQDIPLKQWRKKRMLSQSELAEISGVPLRLIKAYEQQKLDITKAQISTVYKLSCVLDCEMKDLLV